MYEFITKYKSPNYTAGNNPKQIVIHHWGKEGQTFSGVVNWLCNPASGVSAQYVVEDGKCAEIVSCSNTAWHAGDFYVNSHSIGIECRPEMTDGDLNTLIEVVADIFKAYGVIPVIGHKDVVPTACPGKYYAKLSYIKDEAVKLIGKKPSKPKKPKKVKEDGYWGVDTTKVTQKLFGTYADGIVSNQLSTQKKYCLNMVTSSWQFGEYNGYNSPMIQKLQKLVGVKADGWIGYDTIVALQKFLKKKGCYKGEIDGYAGVGTVKGWQKYLNK